MPGFCRFGVRLASREGAVVIVTEETGARHLASVAQYLAAACSGNKKGPILRSNLSCLAAPDGFEPPMPESESGALPLGDGAIKRVGPRLLHAGEGVNTLVAMGGLEPPTPAL